MCKKMGHHTMTVFFSLFRKIDTHFDFRSPAKVLEAFEAALEILVLGPVHIKKTNLLQDTLDDKKHPRSEDAAPRSCSVKRLV